MSDLCSDVQFNGQRVELLPARTVLSTFARGADAGQGGGGTDPVSSLLTRIPVLDKLVPSGNDGFVGSGGNGNGGV